MRKRLITGACIVIGITLQLLLAQTVWYALLWAIICAWITVEYLCAFDMLKNLQVSIPAIVVSFAAPLLTFIPQSFEGGIGVCFAVVLGYMMLQVTLAVLFYNRADSHVISTVTFGVIYTVLAFCALVILIYAHPKHNIVLVFPAIIGPIVSDTCALFAGMWTGKHKLAPELSPKKTIEGSIGGVVGCVIVFYVYAYVVLRVTDLTPRWIPVGIFGVFISVLAQMGDLLMSKIKRETGIKDFGKVFPGHGGMLDRFDSMLPTAIVCLLFAMLPEAFRLFY